ncbi:MAG: thioredoxin family protein [Propionivibrio sp.]
MTGSLAPEPRGGEPTRAEVDSFAAPLLVEFGAVWCGHCQRARPLLDDALARHPEIHHLRVEDGPGRRLGRSFRVKLWPTLVFMHRGVEVARLVRPIDIQEIDAAIERLRRACQA